MLPSDLRQKYPEFVYEDFSWHLDNSNLDITFTYSTPPDHVFHHEIIFRNLPQIDPDAVNEQLIFHLGLSEMFTYWKATCSSTINIKAGQLSPESLIWWQQLFIKGMGEYFYKHQIDFTSPNFLTLNSTPVKISTHVPHQPNFNSNSVLVPVGGGKDSIVTLELLKQKFSVTPFVINPVPIMEQVINIASVNPTITVDRTIDPYLFTLNHRGFLNGHVPISVFYAFASILAAYLTGNSAIAFSNERSSNEGNTTFLGHEINHQYSKTLEFETLLNSYLHSPTLGIRDVSCFSLLRPLYELQITQIFSHFPQYFPAFSSCNNNFKMDPALHPQGSLWCKHCPKCISTSLMLACFIGIDQVTEIMGGFPPELPENQKIISELLGQTPIKPFECVLSRAEANAAWDFIYKSNPSSLNQLLQQRLTNPNLPAQYSQILPQEL